MDGGTTSLRAVDEAGATRHLLLAQHARPAKASSRWRPGRLYFDDEIIGVRSEDEARLLAILRAATVLPPASEPPLTECAAPRAYVLGEDVRRVLAGGPDDRLRAMLAGVVEFVGSAEYVAFAARVDGASR